MGVTFNQLYYFMQAAETIRQGKITPALQQAPGAKTALARLEKELGVPLVERGDKGLVLTEPGLVFLSHTEKILTDLEAAAKDMEIRAKLYNGHVNLGYVSMLSRTYIPNLLESFADSYGAENAVVHTEEATPEQIIQGLRENHYDIALCANPPSASGIECVPLERWPLVLLVPTRHPFCAAREISLEQIAAQPLITYQKDLPLYPVVSQLFEKQGLAPNICHYAASESVIVRLVAKGFGVGLAAATGGKEDYPVTALRPACICKKLTICLLYRENQRHGKAACALIRKIMNLPRTTLPPQNALPF